MFKLLRSEGKRFKIGRVALAVFGASFCLFLFNYLMKYIYGEPFNWDVYLEYFPNHLLGTIAITVFSFFTLNHFHTLFIQRKRFKSFLLPLLLCILLIQVYNIAIDYLMPLQSNIDNPLPIARQVVGNMIVAVLYIIFILVLTTIYYLGDVRRHNQLLEEQKLKLEVEKTRADLKFLKSQINPHFLYNTLNSFYARSLPHSKDLAEGILTLSEMMRYALGEAYTEDGKVLLRDELEHLYNFIKMNQFRFRNTLNVTLEISGKANDIVIIPFVLITLVENIFKHGDLMNERNPCNISIDIKESSLRYYSWNLKKAGPKELSTGIGLDNIQKRLHLAYGNNYKIQIKDEQNSYSTELILQEL
jgi:LytS/YehU family sensor histidine kinase